jgi:hypothetical protein
MSTARELSAHLASLLRNERDAMADFLVALADFDRRRAWAELGHANLFSFLTRDLGLSNGAAAYRKTAANLVARFPEVADALRRGELCITSVVALAKVITPENRTVVLPRFFRLSKRDAMEIVAELKPVETPPMRAVVTSVAPTTARSIEMPTMPAALDAPPPRGASSRLADRLDASSPAEDRGLLSRPQANVVEPSSEPKPATVDPLTADLRRLHLTVSKRFLDKLSAARDALSHAKPGATSEQLLEAGLDLLLAQDAKRKGFVQKPRKTPPPSSDPDRVPAHVRREVLRRDGGRCQVPLASGGICGSTYQVQMGHYPTPRARGGRPTLDNLRCECLPHNQEQANRDFGEAFMARCRDKRKLRLPEPL